MHWQKMDWCEVEDIYIRLRYLMQAYGWVELDTIDFAGDIVFYKEEKKQMLYVINVGLECAPRHRVKKDAYKVYHMLKEEVDVYYGYATPSVVLSKRKKCVPAYCSEQSLRRLRSMR